MQKEETVIIIDQHKIQILDFVYDLNIVWVILKMIQRKKSRVYRGRCEKKVGLRINVKITKIMKLQNNEEGTSDPEDCNYDRNLVYLRVKSPLPWPLVLVIPI